MMSTKPQRCVRIVTKVEILRLNLGYIKLVLTKQNLFEFTNTMYQSKIEEMITSGAILQIIIIYILIVQLLNSWITKSLYFIYCKLSFNALIITIHVTIPNLLPIHYVQPNLFTTTFGLFLYNSNFLISGVMWLSMFVCLKYNTTEAGIQGRV